MNFVYLTIFGRNYLSIRDRQWVMLCLLVSLLKVHDFLSVKVVPGYFNVCLHDVFSSVNTFVIVISDEGVVI